MQPTRRGNAHDVGASILFIPPTYLTELSLKFYLMATTKPVEITVYPPPEASQGITVRCSEEFWDNTAGNGAVYIVVERTLMRLPPFSLRRHSQYFNDMFSLDETGGNGPQEGHLLTCPLFMPSHITLRAITPLFRHIYGAVPYVSMLCCSSRG
ncbi:unnamed protein product [Peniophora sp. CBMAI 1063]|nr:unnamed protein product [Peniophora sp. CBMAI 1063]